MDRGIAAGGSHYSASARNTRRYYRLARSYVVSKNGLLFKLEMFGHFLLKKKSQIHRRSASRLLSTEVSTKELRFGFSLPDELYVAVSLDFSKLYQNKSGESMC